MSSEREKFLINNSLICLLKALEGKVTVIELRNENAVTGRIDNVDAYMNVTMSNVVFETYTGKSNEFTSFFVHGVNIRYVHIPDEIDIRRAMEKQLRIGKNIEAKVASDIREAALKKMRRRDREYQKNFELKERQRIREMEEKAEQK